jgi:magnesium chelatase family protein
MLAAVASATLSGAVGRPVSVEVHVSNGLPGFTIVGLPDAAVREARDRVRAAILSSGLPWPMRRITANLAPSRFQNGNHGKIWGEAPIRPPPASLMIGVTG